jgi:3-dehydroquinate synthase
MTPTAAVPTARVIRVELGPRSYDIRIQPGLIAQAGALLAPVLTGRRLLVVTDRTVGPLYGRVLASSLQKAGFDGSAVELPPGEGAKSLKCAEFLYDRCLEAGLDRACGLVAVGGGVIGDLTGFVAATFMRGIDFVQAPTTLLAMVDASVGGKTAVDHPRAKNAIGAFHQPRAVLIDPLTLKTLPPRELKAGLAEVIKHGVIADAELFAYCEAHAEEFLACDAGALGHVIEVSCRLKARIVGEDERERDDGPRALLNFGHTFAHAIEACTGYQTYRHGEAVALGMVLAAELSAARGLLKPEAAARIRTLLQRVGLPTTLRPGDPDAASLQAATLRDKKARAGRVRFVLATALGRAAAFADVPEEQARQVWEAGRRSE